ncbi:putative hydrolase [Cercophora samala]|uniref:Hydrolase n=1 Tax=Cercophora samala TaxID=330535 RepID=A0AA39Z0S3_9PEZI|nr:putative hydrolase [Cercophora samala]
MALWWGMGKKHFSSQQRGCASTPPQHHLNDNHTTTELGTELPLLLCDPSIFTSPHIYDNIAHYIDYTKSPNMSLFQYFIPDRSNTPLIVALTASITTITLILLNRILYPPLPKLLRSPLKTVLPTLPKDELEKLEYKPDTFPGARDVETPYGSIRVYEFGPVGAAKVLLVHGISTPCTTLTKLALSLANHPSRPSRVMLFDLFGRGYSDNPADLPHDARLYVTQILIALASSPLPWTGSDNSFNLIGYSLGGAIATHFAVSFPHLVKDLVLLAPAGMIRPASFGTLTRKVFTSGVLPRAFLHLATRRRLRRPIRSSTKKGKATAKLHAKEQLQQDPASKFVEAETADDVDGNGEPRTGLERKVLRQVQQQLVLHEGFVDAFMACLKDAPLMGQEGAYEKLALRGGEKGKKTVIILGRDDELVNPGEYEEDLKPLLQEGNVVWKVVKGGHDFPMTWAEEVLEVVYEVWSSKTTFGNH